MSYSDLADAIERGAKLRPQTTGFLFVKHWQTGEICSCVWGAALEGSGYEADPDGSYSIEKLLIDYGLEIDGLYSGKVIAKAPHPNQIGKVDSLFWVMADANDNYEMTREEIKQDYLYTAECWLYRDLPERQTCLPDKMLIYLLMNNYRRVFLCGSHENNCSQEFYDNAYGYKSDVAFITGHFKNGLHFLSKGYDEGLSDYHCPGCGAKIEGGQEIYLQFDQSI